MFGKIFALLAVVLAGVGCSEERDIVGNYIPPVKLVVYVEDAETGANLLDSGVEGNILGNRIVVSKPEKSYIVCAKMQNVEYDRERECYLYPLPVELENGVLPCLVLGGFWAEDNYRDYSIDVDWGDGMKSEFRLNCYVPADFSEDWCCVWLDGTLVGAPGNWNITIKK